ncbi:hypothetical protein [Parachlamydia sp. AcF125]|uniref:hypothetical protein n=1 Tax=Parachlamydia sp. AcF125 TaxID=2795736 RepID=UPI001BCA08F2|nr:hypothetical protein [Parachlamydia sp. AcF125]MBS4168264.1 hypothetical protein [Parachlamydia sp. AcF125]
MKISIAERLRPFSHLPGTFCLLPYTALRFQIFPTLIHISSLANSSPEYIGRVKLDLTGPVEEFTIQQDLEKGEIKVWGHASEGYFDYRIFAENDGSIKIVQERGFELNFSPSFDCQSQPKAIVFKSSVWLAPHPPTERLSLGNHKAQDWDLIKRRKNFAEIFPHWFRLGSLVPFSEIPENPHPSLLQACENALQQQPEKILKAFFPLFAAGFEGILSPRSQDLEHLGFKSPPIPSHLSPLYLLKQGAQLIRSLFMKIEPNTLSLLPSLPPEFHCGRAVNWQAEGIGTIHFEWSKKTLRRVILYSSANQTLHFNLQSPLKRMRLRTTPAEKGSFISCHAPLEVLSDQLYLFDNFQK